MVKYAVMTDTNIAEGIAASLLMPALIYFFRHKEKINFYITSVFAWFITWIIRKFTVNTFEAYKLNNNLSTKTYYIDLPINV